MELDKKRFWWVLAALVLTFAALRIWLSLTPNADFNIGGYNIHHLYTGLVLIMVGGLPLAVFRGTGMLLNLAALLFGVGMALALDEWVYLIATDGSNASYLLPVSFWGGVVMVSLACLYLIGMAWWANHRRTDQAE